MEKQQYLYKSLNHAAHLNEMRLKDKWCDVTIKVNKKDIRAHKVVLAANLKYFDAMLSNDSFQESKDGIINMVSVEEANLEAFVSYAYTGEILLTDSNVLNLLELANYLNEDDIKKACIEFLAKHLKMEEACRAYKFADIIESIALKKAAKDKILENFEICSTCNDYFSFDQESLTGILSDGKSQPVKIQQMMFEGILRWIMHDPKDRKIHMNGLLSHVDIIKFSSDGLIGYLYENIADHNDEYNIIKDIMFYYHTSKIEQKKQEQVLMVIGSSNSKNYSQYYSFTERKWSSLQTIQDVVGVIRPCNVVLSDKLYYISEISGVNHLRVFHPSTRRTMMLNSSDSVLGGSAMSECSRFIYLCGGAKNDKSRSNQVFKYHPQTNSFEALTPMITKRSCAASIFYQGCLYVLGGIDGSSMLDSVEKYDPATQKWITIQSMTKKRYCHAVAILDGKLYACGGYPADNSVEVYDPIEKCWRKIARMNYPRYYFTVIPYEGKLMAFGGNAYVTVEVYDPNKDQWQIDIELSSGLQIVNSQGGLISASCIASNK